MHCEELHNLYSSPNIRMNRLTKMRWAGHVTLTGEMGNAYKDLVGKSECKRPVGRSRCE
jgi:hypothetical protein